MSDIDALINELDAIGGHPKLGPTNSAAAVPPPQKPNKNDWDDDDDKVDRKSSANRAVAVSEQFDDNSPSPNNQYTKTPVVSPDVLAILRRNKPVAPKPLALGRRCNQPVVTGMATKAYGCPFLICLQCDNPVLRFEGLHFAEDTSYLFLRNSYPDTTRLARQLRVPLLPDSTTYTCQCTFYNVRESMETLQNTSKMQWRCSGH